MKIAVLQQNIPIGNSTVKGEYELKKDADNSVDRCIQMIAEASEKGAELCVTIETVNAYLSLGDTRFKYTDTLDGETVRKFSVAAKRYGVHIVAGLALSIDGVPYNCAVLFDDNGDIVGVHKKVHLPAGEELHYAHGDRLEVFETKLGRIGMLVCWDLQFPEAARELALGGADMIACPTYGWEKIYGLSRAYENSIYIAAGMCTVGSNRNTLSSPACIVDNMGRMVAEAPWDVESVTIADIDIKKEPEPQYNSQTFYPSHSMRKTRFSQRQPEAYRLTGKDNRDVPLYKRYFEKK